MCNTEPGNPIRVAPLNFDTVEQDLPFTAVKCARSRFEQGRFSCSICAEYRDDLAFVNVQADAANRHDRPIVSLDVTQFEQRYCHAAAPR